MPVSWLAALVGTLAGFVLGSIWYGPLFGKAWMAEHGFTVEGLKQNFKPVRLYGTSLVLGFLAAYVFGIFLGPHRGLGFGTLAGFAAGLAWVGTSFATSYLYEGKSGRLLLINGGYHTFQFTLYGMAFGLLG